MRPDRIFFASGTEAKPLRRQRRFAGCELGGLPRWKSLSRRCLIRAVRKIRLWSHARDKAKGWDDRADGVGFARAAQVPHPPPRLGSKAVQGPTLSLHWERNPLPKAPGATSDPAPFYRSPSTTIPPSAIPTGLRISPTVRPR